jgi:CBS domain-containing protein
MIVKDILAAKGDDVVTISPTANLADAAAVLANRHIGALVVTGAGDRLVGIVSERDVVRQLAAHGTKALEMPLTDVMTRKVATCLISDTVSSIMERMTSGKFRHIPVVDGERMIGIISIGDVVKLRLHEMENEQTALRDYIQTA